MVFDPTVLRFSNLVSAIAIVAADCATTTVQRIHISPSEDASTRQKSSSVKNPPSVADLLAGNLSICTAITEPGVGSNPENVTTRAMATGGGTSQIVSERRGYQKGLRCDMQTSMAKLFVTQAGARIAHRCLTTFGGNGLSPEYPFEGGFRDARIMTVPDGTSGIQRLLIARNLTGLSAF